MANLPVLCDVEEFERRAEKYWAILNEAHPERIWKTDFSMDGVDIFLLDTDGQVLAKALWLREGAGLHGHHHEEQIKHCAREMILLSERAK